MSASEFYNMVTGIGDAYTAGLDRYRKRQGDDDAKRVLQTYADTVLNQSQPQSLAALGASMPAQAPSAPGLGDLGRAGSAISGIESGGRYDATGPVTRTGDRAFGRYQVMGANIGPWSQEILGRQVSPQEFIASPQIQDAIFKGKFGQYVQKYGPEGAARAWFAGEGGMNNPNAKDQLGTSVASYGQKFAQAYGPGATAPGGPAQQAIGQAAPQGGLAALGAAIPAAGASPAGPAPVQMAQAAPQQRFNPQEAAALRAMLANPQTQPIAMQIIQSRAGSKIPQWEKLNDGTLFDKNSGNTRSIGDGAVYKMLTDPAERAKYGIQADDKRPYQLDPAGKLSGVGGATTNVNIDKGESAFEQEAGKATAKRYNDDVEAGSRANVMLGDIQTMREISSRAGSQGSTADIKATLGPYAEALGIEIAGLSDIQAFNSVVQRLAPQMRVPGSGSTSDVEFKGMLASLPRLSNNPAAREAVLNSMEASARHQMQRAEIASKVLNKEITRGDGEKQLRALPDPMTGFRAFRKANPELFTGPAQTAGSPPAGRQAPAAGAPVRVQTPDEARRLPKGTPIILPDGRQGVVP